MRLYTEIYGIYIGCTWSTVAYFCLELEHLEGIRVHGTVFLPRFASTAATAAAEATEEH